MRPVLIAVVAVVFAARASAACLPVIEGYPIEPLKPGGEWVDLYGSAFGCAPLPQFARIVADPPYLTPGGGVFGPWTEPAHIPVSGPDSAVRFRLFTDIPRTVRFVWTDSVQTRVLQISVRARIDLKLLAPGVLHASIVGEPNLAAPALVQRLGPEGWYTTKRVLPPAHDFDFRVKRGYAAAVRLVLPSAALVSGWSTGVSNPIAA